MSGNYTGPYWSDGKIQESVEFGDAPVMSELDRLSRLHDTAYAHYKDAKHREAADLIYAREAKKLGASDRAIGDAVQYGNYAARGANKLLDNVSTGSAFGPLGMAAGAVYTAVGNIVDSQKRIDGTYLAKEIGDVQSLYDRDPWNLRPTEKVQLSNRGKELTEWTSSTLGRARAMARAALAKTQDEVSRLAKNPVIHNPTRIVPEHESQTHIVLPNGVRLKRKKRRKSKRTEIEKVLPTPRAAAVAELAHAVSKHQFPQGAVVVNNGFDPTWTIKGRKNKNKVQPRTIN